ncbi:MAG: hypothetical protein LUH02_06125 [Erysipelotrichaceae bacterium]|nr:hypothetical protein [Erysipelotrichaceae bacterium]
MKKLLLCLCMIFVIGCQSNNEVEDNLEINNIEEQDDENMNIIIENQSFAMTLYDNETTQALVALLPLELSLHQLNNNEQYVYLEETLPNNAASINQIQAGDVMLFGDNCLVIFYKDFNTSYQYTPIGHIDNLDVLLMESSIIHIRLEE